MLGHLVQCQTALLHEAPAAMRTVQRVLLRVRRPLVHLELGGRREPLSANRTNVGTGVFAEEVRIKAALQTKRSVALRTGVTAERLGRARMNPPVPVQVAGIPEALVAVCALVRQPSSPVRQKVPVEVTLLREGLKADRAGQRLFRCGRAGLLDTRSSKPTAQMLKRNELKTRMQEF